MQSVIQDLRYSLRQLIHNPGFTLTAVISLALGMGATTAVFSVIYAALIDPYPYPEVDRIVRLTIRSKGESGQGASINGPQVRQLQQMRTLDSVLAMDYHPLTMTGTDLPENVNAIGLIANGFRDLGVAPVLGRNLGPGDAPEGHDTEPVVVLAYKFWKQKYFSDPNVVGKALQLDRKPYTIVGVAAPRFTWYSADIYLPLKLTQDPGIMFFADLRMKRGVTQFAVNAELQPLLEQFARDLPRHYPEHFTAAVEDLNAWVVRSISGTLYLLLGAVGLLLAIGCGNVSILLLARGAARQHELAVRAAVGAGSGRLTRQMLTESLVLAGIGVALGVALSFAILAGLRLLLPAYAFAPEVVVRINLPVLVFSGVVAMATGLLFGLWPALQLSRTQVGQMMQWSARRVAGSVHARRMHSGLIAGQIAVTLLLLAGAGAAMEGFVELTHRPLGYDPHHVMSVRIPLHDNSYTAWAARAEYYEQLRNKVAETPGVTMAAISSNATPPENGWDSRFEILGRPSLEQQTGSLNMVSPEYFAALRIPLQEGRLWSATENRNGAHVALINRTLAQRYFPTGGALGHAVRLPGLEERPPVILTIPHVAESPLAIVGIVGDARNAGVGRPVEPAIYVPYTLSMAYGTQILVRSEVEPLTLLRGVRAQVAMVNPEQQTGNAADLDEWVSDEPEWQQEHLAAWIFGIFAALGLALAAVGLYSVVSYTVAQRTNEFGIRMALGAHAGHVLRIVLASISLSVGSGIAAGLGLSMALHTVLGQWIKGNLRDPMLLLAGAVLLSAVAGMACIIPAWQASKVDPMTALRCE